MSLNKFFYAVRKGRNPGIYTSWTECEKQVKNFPGPEFKKFATELEAERFLNNTKKVKKGYSLYTDGGSRNNPGVGGCGAVLYSGSSKIASCYYFLGLNVTNNVAEYLGVLHGLSLAHVEEVKKLDVFCDSALVVNQLNGSWKINDPELKKLNGLVRSQLTDFTKLNFTHIPREENKEADDLSNQGMDLSTNF